MKNNLEQQFKQLESAEFDFNPQDWELMSKKLDAEFGALPKPSIWKSAWVKGAAAVLVLGGLATASYHFITSPNQEIGNEKAIVAQDNTSESVEETSAAIQNKHNNTATSDQATKEVENYTVDEDPVKETANLDDSKPSNPNEPIKENGSDPVKETPIKEMPKNTDVLAAANMKFNVMKQNSCPGEAIVFTVESPTKGFNYHWEFSDGGIKAGNKVSYTFEQSGKYGVNLIAVEQANQSNIVRNKHNDLINVYEIPMIDFVVENDNQTIKDPYSKFSLSKEFNGKAAWDFGNGHKANGNSVETMYDNKGAYTVKLTLTSNAGCKTVIKKNVSNSFEIDLLPANAFRPLTGNSAETRTFIPRALEVADVEFTMIIKDISSQTVYSTTDVSKPWNGRLNNTAEMLPEGTYFWTVVYKDKNDVSMSQRGKIQLMLK